MIWYKTARHCNDNTLQYVPAMPVIECKNAAHYVARQSRVHTTLRSATINCSALTLADLVGSPGGQMRIGEVLGMMIAPGLKPAEDRRSSGPQMAIPWLLSCC